MNTNLEGNRVEQEDIDNIMHNVKHDRQPIRVVSMFYLHRIGDRKMFNSNYVTSNYSI
jgi:hypothetical protein